MEQKNANCFDVRAGNGEQIQEKSAGGNVRTGKSMSGMQTLVGSICQANESVRNVLVTSSGYKNYKL